MKKWPVFLTLFLLLSSSAVWGYRFGDSWKFSACQICKRNFSHVGMDFSARKGQAVLWKMQGYVFKKKHLDSSWKWCLVLSDKANSQTYVVWHLDKIPDFKPEEVILPGRQIGVVADLGSNSHLHLGLRRAPFHQDLSMKGALPSCSHKPKSLPKFPEKFASPDERVISIK